MYYDAPTAAAVADECRLLLSGGRVQQVVQVDDLTVGFEIYARQERQYLIASADAQRARVHLTGVKLRRGVETPTPLLLLLRKYVRDGHVVSVRQPPFERILRIEVESAEGTFTLIVEAMGRHSNVILCEEDGTVLDAVKRVGLRLSRVRPILPGDLYVPPPPQDKLDPTDVTELRLRELLDGAEGNRPAWRALVNGIRGVSPLLAKEIVYRATGTVETGAHEVGWASPLLDAFQGIVAHTWEHDWQPCVATEEGRVVAFSPYALTQYPERERVDTIGEAIDLYYAATAGADAYAPAKAQVVTALRGARERVTGRRQALERQLIPQAEVDGLRLRGEMILAYAHTVQHGQRKMEAQVDWDQPPLHIDLDPELTAVQNAQAYFRRYEKAKAATAGLPNRIARADLDLAYLDQLSTDLELASNWPEIDEVRSGLVETGHMPERRRVKMQQGQPLRVAAEDGTLILVGRSARQNQEVTFRHAAPDDLWLHAVDVPGAHVIVKCEGRPVADRTLRQAARLAAAYSAARGEAGVLVAYTQRRYVRRIRGAGPGMVTYRGEQTIRVSLEKDAG